MHIKNFKPEPHDQVLTARRSIETRKSGGFFSKSRKSNTIKKGEAGGLDDSNAPLI